MTPEEQKQAYDEQQVYRQVFGTPEGRIVLRDIMRRGNAFDLINQKDEGDVAARNFVIGLWLAIGAIEGDEDAMERLGDGVVAAALNTPVMPLADLEVKPKEVDPYKEG